ncbi:endonuclease domain-containing 1 protein [Danio aesculapii]|uniref:endonuclease domain-containing 1 protein n=1 Tax=Danio aesculapii TaxID=1142201 RepID=UPI0024BF1EBA|nr:endonuclease domain-containing 1 protein [Danio aesculapii]
MIWEILEEIPMESLFLTWDSLQLKMRLFVVCALLVFSFPFIITEVVDSFSKCSEFFLEGKPPVIPGILKDSVSQDNNRYKLICQRYKNAYRFATVYDTTNKIPVFSAYRYTGFKKGRPHIRWMIEPQLETSGVQMSVRHVNQAYTEDYRKWSRLDRGHLFPNGHAANKDIAESTFTLTNVVPQYKSFNGGSWSRMENDVRDIMESDCPKNRPAYVLTGAVANQEHYLNQKVNVPTHMWNAFCCYNDKTNAWVSRAHWAENKDESEDKKKKIPEKTLKELLQFLEEKYKSEVTLFNKCLDN